MPKKPGRDELPDPLWKINRNRSADSSVNSRLLGLGVQFAAAIILFVVIGQWTDKRYGSDPWGVLVGAILGFGLGMLLLFREARKGGDAGQAGHAGKDEDRGLEE